MRVAYLGPDGTFSHEALLALGVEHVPAPRSSIHDCVVAVQAGDAERALVPLENALEGSVSATLDALVRDAPEVVIAGEVVWPVHHCLVAAEPVALDTVLVVRSHPQGLAQCAAFLRRELPAARLEAAASTADAVRLAVETGQGAAIGSRAAAERYGATILRAEVEDEPGNETRFAWLAPRDEAGAAQLVSARGGGFRTALVWWGAGSTSPGWLVRCLSEFAFRGVNLTRIESRPLRGQPGPREYRFVVDAEGAATEPPLADAIAGLRAHAKVVRVLGSYPLPG